jgi:hypothetical protein
MAELPSTMEGVDVFTRLANYLTAEPKKYKYVDVTPWLPSHSVVKKVDLSVSIEKQEGQWVFFIALISHSNYQSPYDHMAIQIRYKKYGRAQAKKYIKWLLEELRTGKFNPITGKIPVGEEERVVDEMFSHPMNPNRNNCAVCFNPTIVKTNCNHPVCIECITTISKSSNSVCPLCRSEQFGCKCCWNEHECECCCTEDE